MRTRKEGIKERVLDGLSEAQREAVTYTEGPLLILAGPGSGKTRVVTRRATFLATTVTEACRILAITFTNKAAGEMRERIEALGAAEGMTVATFHAFCAKTLRRHHERAGVPANFTILDRDDRRKLVKKAIEDCDLGSGNWSPAAAEREISTAKNAMISVEGYGEAAYGDPRESTFSLIYERYERLQAEMGALDFDDLLRRMAQTLDRDEALRAELESRFQYVLIDEYQDTNAAQYRIAQLLTRDRENLCATGDPDQSIYGWRGADIGNILSFETDYPGARVVRLEQNYRSTKRILAAADALIARNEKRKEKSLWTRKQEGASVRVIEVETGADEAAWVARDVAQRTYEREPLCQIAVFYRVNSLSRMIEEALLREGLRYQVARGVEFYNRREIKDVLAYLRVLINPADELSLLRVINTPPRGIGSTTIARLVAAAGASGRCLRDALGDETVVAGLGRAENKVREFAVLLSELSTALELSPPAALELVISHSGLRALYRDEADGDDSLGRNLDELESAAAAFSQDRPEATLVDWLEHAALVSDVDGVAGDGEKLTLMTLHAAKGLEYDHVYILGMEDGLLPFRRRLDRSLEANDREEERRLCFVGMTRARKTLTLTRARYRATRGPLERTVRSPFLDELPREGVEYIERRGPGRPRRPAAAGDGSPPEDLAEWTIGTLVEHPTHGLGQILSIRRGARRTHAEVLFRNGFRQSWMLEFADLKRVEFDDVGEGL